MLRINNSLYNWQNYQSSISSKAKDKLSSQQIDINDIYEIISNQNNVITSYKEAKQDFDIQLKENTTDLREANSNIKKLSLTEIKQDSIKTSTQIDEDGKEKEIITYDDNLQKAVKDVDNFVQKYNNLLNFSTDYSSTSKRMEKLVNTLKDNAYQTNLYKSIGINVNNDGSLSVDERQLASTMVKNSNKVERLLDNLSTKTDNKLNLIESQQDKLFPTINTFLDKNTSMYTSNALLQMNNYMNQGNLINTLW